MSRQFHHASTFPLLCSCYSRTSFIQAFLVMQVLATRHTYVGTTQVIYGCDVPELVKKGATCKRQVRSPIALRSHIKDCSAFINNTISKFWYKESLILVLYDGSPFRL